MSKKYLFMTLGHSGSGKSYFVRQLIDEIPLVRLNGDTLRIEVYGSTEELDKYKAIDPTLSKEKIFKALDYAAKQILLAGFSVIYEANNNKRVIRKTYEKIAQEHDAIPIVIWVQTPPELAIKRVQEREVTADSRQFDEQKAREVVERHIANTDDPGVGEYVITIDGVASFEEQYKSFKEQLAKIDEIVQGKRIGK